MKLLSIMLAIASVLIAIVAINPMGWGDLLVESSPWLAIGFAAVTADQIVKRQHMSHYSGNPVAASTIIYKGTLVFDAAGYMSGTAGGNKFMGVSRGHYDNSAGANGDIHCEYDTHGRVLLTGSGFVAADVGVKVYAVDNFTISKTSTSNSYIGVIESYVSATQVWVTLDTVSLA